MWWIVEVVTAAVALTPIAFLLAMCRLMRRNRQPDPTTERVLWFCAAWIVVRCIALIALPGHQSPWLVVGSAAPVLLACLALFAVKVHQRPQILEALFSPDTLARLRAARNRLRR